VGAADSYVSAVWQQKRWIASSPPGIEWKLGDVLVLRQGVPRYMTDLESQGIQFTTEPNGRSASWTTQSEKGVRVDFKLKGSVPRGLTLGFLDIDDTGAVVQFASNNSFLLALSQVRFHRIKDLPALGPAIRRKFVRNRWSSNWLIVSELLSAQKGTFLSSHLGDTLFELKAGAKVAVSRGIPIANLAAGFTVMNAPQSTDLFTGRRGLTPLFRAHRWHLLGDVKPARSARFFAAEEREAQYSFDEADPTAD
jgi:hypothetical protein